MVTNIKVFKSLIPTIGTVLFVILYVIATFYYPGGSQFDQQSIGFSWGKNYWCNLLNDLAINCQPNCAKPIAMAAMFILCISHIFFWWQFPKHTSMGKIYQFTIQVCGTFAMSIGILLLSKIDHDLVTNVASLFGLIATMGTLISLYINKWIALFYLGILVMLLVVANNVLYYDRELLSFLPVVQKITFATFLIWVCTINLKIHGLITNTLRKRLL
jgi:hypothetical protein